MNKSRNEELRAAMREARKKEKQAQLAALRQIRDNPDAEPGDRLEAIKLISELDR